MVRPLAEHPLKVSLTIVVSIARAILHKKRKKMVWPDTHKRKTALPLELSMKVHVNRQWVIGEYAGWAWTKHLLWPLVWKGIGFILHTCVVQYSLCYVGSSVWLHSKVHRSISLVSLCIVYAQYSMCYDASSTGILLHIKCNVQWQCLYFYYAMFNSLVVSQIYEKAVPTKTGVIGIPYNKHAPHVYHVADQSEPKGWSRMRWGI